MLHELDTGGQAMATSSFFKAWPFVCTVWNSSSMSHKRCSFSPACSTGKFALEKPYAARCSMC